MTNLSRRTLLLSLLAATALPAFDQQSWAQQQNSVPTPNPFRYEDVVRRARELARRPVRGTGLAAARAAEPAQLRRLPRHPLPHRQGPARRRRRSVPAAALPSRLPLPAPGDGERHPRRRSDPGGLSAGAVRLRPQQDRAAAAGQSRLCRLSPPLSPERSEGAGRAHRLPRRELFPLPGFGSEIRPLGAGPRDQRGGRRGGGVSAFPRILDRDAQAQRRAGHHLRPARQPVRGRRLPVRDLSVEGNDPRHHGDALPASAHHQCGRRSPHLDVFRGRERPQAVRRFPARAARFGRAAHAVRAPASGSGAPSAIRPRRRSPPSATTTRAASA